MSLVFLQKIIMLPANIDGDVFLCILNMFIYCSWLSALTRTSRVMLNRYNKTFLLGEEQRIS